jgi:cell wall-associated NlpC family hydrolase
VVEYQNLIGRPFRWGKTDCIGLVRDFYAQNYGIKITDYARPTNWNADNLDIIRATYHAEGFDMITRWRVNDLQVGDLLAMCIASSNPNHLAIVLPDNEILQHKYNSLSNVETFRDAYRNFTSFVLRHPDVPRDTGAKPDTTIQELLSARYLPEPS